MKRAGLASIRRKTGGGLNIDRPIAEQRVAFARLLELTEVGMPEHQCRSLRVADIPCLQLTPRERSDDRLLLFIHGGGYSLGSAATHRPLAARIARPLGVEALLPDYRLAPEHPCPAGLDDTLAVWRALPERVRARAILAGDSAGGGLALALTMTLRDTDEILPSALVLLSPWTDLTVSGESVDRLAEHEIMLARPGLELMAARYAGSLARNDPRVSPLFGRFEDFPRTLIQVGGHEVLLDDARRLADRAAAAGVAVTLQVWERQNHVFQATPMLESAASAIAEIAAWISGSDRRSRPARRPTTEDGRSPSNVTIGARPDLDAGDRREDVP
ncbi:MAG TPA: alpha/beta hydrolase [Enhygromyxa sp.]|nr:alpha/beta hydrolase [Enhygromyxa sp.]